MLQEYLRRIGLLLGGLLVSAIGITLMLQANIGLEPWSVLQQGMSKTFGITYGTAASIAGAAVIAIAYFCGESFGLGTLANIFVCPIFIDILLYLNWVPLFERFSTGLAALLIGMELLALGTWMYMKSTLGSGPRDALMVVLARKTHRTVGLCRAAVEVVIVFIGWRSGGHRYHRCRSGRRLPVQSELCSAALQPCSAPSGESAGDPSAVPWAENHHLNARSRLPVGTSIPNGVTP